MPVKKRASKVKSNRITPAAVEAYRNGDQMALHLALGLRPWEPNPLDPLENATPGTAYEDSLPKVRELRADLEAALREND